MYRSLSLIFVLLTVLLGSCQQDPTVEGRWAFDKVDAGTQNPAKTFEFLGGTFSEGYSDMCFTDLQPVGQYSFDGSHLQVFATNGCSYNLVYLADYKAIFDIKDSTGSVTRAVYIRP